VPKYVKSKKTYAQKYTLIPEIQKRKDEKGYRLRLDQANEPDRVALFGGLLRQFHIGLK
jgi:hypothetical protein